MEIVRSRVYIRKSTSLLSDAEMLAAENEIIAAPEKWPVISGTGGMRKARAASGSSGKKRRRVDHVLFLAERNGNLLPRHLRQEPKRKSFGRR